MCLYKVTAFPLALSSLYNNYINVHMKFPQRWRNFTNMGVTICNQCDSFPRFTHFHMTRPQISCSAPTRNRIERPQISTAPKAEHPTCSSRHYVPSSPIRAHDPFQAQLLACRDQAWWDDNRENVSVPADTETPIVRPEAPKRSLSIREIRERMNSDQRSVTSISSIGEFEPGLRLLDNRYGTWEDMEMFID